MIQSPFIFSGLTEKAVDHEHPWLGLLPFTESTRDYFFGRSGEIDEIYDRVKHKPLTILYGQSGLGKTSLIRAGLLPRLRQESLLPILIRLRYPEAVDGDSEEVWADLSTQVREELVQELDAAGFPQLAHACRAPVELWAIFHSLQNGFLAPGSPKVVLLFDQFEEIFTLGERVRGAVTRFFSDLTGLVENRPSPALSRQIEEDDDLYELFDYSGHPCRVLIVLREDFLSRLERHRHSMPSLRDNRMELRLLTGTQALEAVIEPGRLSGRRLVSDAVGCAIVRFVAKVDADIPIEEIDAVPPLLSLMCRELNERRIRAGKMEIQNNLLESSSRDILSGFYEDCFFGEHSALRELVEDRLLSPGGYRESVSWETAVSELEEEQVSEPALALTRLIDRRLLSAEERAGIRRLELTHDVLTGLALASRDERRERSALEDARRETEAARRRAEDIRHQRNRLRRWVVVAGVCALVASAGAAFGIVGMLRAKKAAIEAGQAFDTARDTTDEFLVRIGSDTLSHLTGILPVREEMAAKAIAQYGGLLEKRPGDIRLRVAHAKALMAQAEILGQIGTMAEATAAHEKSTSNLRSLLELHPDSEVEVLLAEAALEFWRFLYNSGLPVAKDLAVEALRLSEPHLGDEWSVPAAAVAIMACNGLGNLAAERSEKISHFAKGREIALAHRDSVARDHPKYPDFMFGFSATTWNLSRQKSFQEEPTEKEAAEKLWQEGLALDQELSQSVPESPLLLRNSGISLQWEAESHANEGRMVEARQSWDQCIALWRKAVVSNPHLTYYQQDFVKTLKDFGIFLMRQEKVTEAREAYAEAATLAKDLIGKRADRPINGTSLLQVFHQLAETEQFDGMAGGKGNPEAAARIRGEAIDLGRQLVSDYPSALSMIHEFANMLWNQAIKEPVLSKPDAAIPLLKEAIEAMEQYRDLDTAEIRDWHASSRLKYSTALLGALDKQAKSSPPNNPTITKTQVLEEALEWESYVSSTDAMTALLELANARCILLREAGDHPRILEIHSRLVDRCQAAYEEKPYLFYLREPLAALYRHAADAHQARGDISKEVDARQTAVRIGDVPNYRKGLFADILVPNIGQSESLLGKLRTVSEWKPKSKMFSIPCEVAGNRVPVQFYIYGGVPDEGMDPLEDQARWLEEERGVKVPDDVREAIRKLTVIAMENDVDFVDLCTYALNFPTDDAASERNLMQNAQDMVAKSMAAPTDSALAGEAAKALRNLADFLKKKNRTDEALEKYRQELEFRRRVIVLEGRGEGSLKPLSSVLWSLGTLCKSLNRREEALAFLLEELSIVREMMGLSGESLANQESLAGSLDATGEVLTDANRAGEAVVCTEQSVAVRRRLLTQAVGEERLKARRLLAVSLHLHGKALAKIGWGEMPRSLTNLGESTELFVELAAEGGLGEDQTDWPDISRRWQSDVAELLQVKDQFDRQNTAAAALAIARKILDLGAGKVGQAMVAEAIGTLEGIREGETEWIEARKMLVRHFVHIAPDSEKALRLLSDWLSLKPKDLDALKQYADLLQSNGQFALAAQSFEKLKDVALADAPETGDVSHVSTVANAMLSAGKCWQEDGRASDVERVLSGALEWIGRYSTDNRVVRDLRVQCHESLAQLYLREPDQLEKALEQQKFVIGLLEAPFDQSQQSSREMNIQMQNAQVDLAKIYNALGPSDNRIAAWEKVIHHSTLIFYDVRTEGALGVVMNNWKQFVAANFAHEKWQEAADGADAALAFLAQHDTKISDPAKLREIRRPLLVLSVSTLSRLKQFQRAAEKGELLVGMAREEWRQASKDKEGAAKLELADKLTSLAWHHLFAQQFEQAIRSSEEAQMIARRVWTEGNLAHALMFAGRDEEARAIYLRQRGSKLEINDGVSWEEMVKADFAEFRAAGLEHSLMPEIESALGIEIIATPGAVEPAAPAVETKPQ